jgi:hypothetical protein
MRWIFLSAGLTVAALQTGCDRPPQAFGITGPAPQVQPELTPDDTTILAPGIPNSTGSGSEQRFYNYN